MFLTKCTGVRSCYDEGKRVAETLMFDYHRQHGIGKSYSCLSFLVPLLFKFMKTMFLMVMFCMHHYGSSYVI